MNYLKVGTIITTHGIKGEVKVKSDTSFREDRYKIGNKLYLQFEGEMIEIKIDSYRVHKGFDLITFNNLKNINDVLMYVGLDIYVHKDDLEELEEEEFYFDTLIGMDILDEGSVHIGVITDVMEVPQGEILVIKTKENKELLIPFVFDYVITINEVENYIVIKIPEVF